MNDFKHKTTNTSTCTACHEYKRDMDGTVATLERERAIKKELLDALQSASDWIDAQIGNPRIDIQEKVRQAISKAKQKMREAIAKAAEGRAA